MSQRRRHQEWLCPLKESIQPFKDTVTKSQGENCAEGSQLYCKECDLSFQDLVSCHAHNSSKHPKSQDGLLTPSSCKDMGNSTACNNITDSHSKPRKEQMPVLCDFCGDIFPNVKEMRRHARHCKLAPEVHPAKQEKLPRPKTASAEGKATKAPKKPPKSEAKHELKKSKPPASEQTKGIKPESGMKPSESASAEKDKKSTPKSTTVKSSTKKSKAPSIKIKDITSPKDTHSQSMSNVAGPKWGTSYRKVNQGGIHILQVEFFICATCQSQFPNNAMCLDHQRDVGHDQKNTIRRTFFRCPHCSMCYEQAAACRSHTGFQCKNRPEVLARAQNMLSPTAKPRADVLNVSTPAPMPGTMPRSSVASPGQNSQTAPFSLGASSPNIEHIKKQGYVPMVGTPSRSKPGGDGHPSRIGTSTPFLTASPTSDVSKAMGGLSMSPASISVQYAHILNNMGPTTSRQSKGLQKAQSAAKPLAPATAPHNFGQNAKSFPMPPQVSRLAPNIPRPVSSTGKDIIISLMHKCSQCDTKFLSKMALEQHVQLTHGRQVKNTVEPQPSPKPRQPLRIVPKPGPRFPTPRESQNTNNQVATSQVQMVYACDVSASLTTGVTVRQPDRSFVHPFSSLKQAQALTNNYNQNVHSVSQTATKSMSRTVSSAYNPEQPYYKPAVESKPGFTVQHTAVSQPDMMLRQQSISQLPSSVQALPMASSQATSQYSNSQMVPLSSAPAVRLPQPGLSIQMVAVNPAPPQYTKPNACVEPQQPQVATGLANPNPVVVPSLSIPLNPTLDVIQPAIQLSATSSLSVENFVLDSQSGIFVGMPEETVVESKTSSEIGIQCDQTDEQGSLVSDTGSIENMDSGGSDLTADNSNDVKVAEIVKSSETPSSSASSEQGIKDSSLLGNKRANKADLDNYIRNMYEQNLKACAMEQHLRKKVRKEIKKSPNKARQKFVASASPRSTQSEKAPSPDCSLGESLDGSVALSLDENLTNLCEEQVAESLRLLEEVDMDYFVNIKPDEHDEQSFSLGANKFSPREQKLPSQSLSSCESAKRTEENLQKPALLQGGTDQAIRAAQATERKVEDTTADDTDFLGKNKDPRGFQGLELPSGDAVRTETLIYKNVEIIRLNRPTCTVCKEKFCHEADVKQHKKTSWDCEVQSARLVREYEFVCPHCFCVFSAPKLCRSHSLTTCLKEAGLKIRELCSKHFQCELCTRKYFDAATLKRHVSGFHNIPAAEAKQKVGEWYTEAYQRSLFHSLNHERREKSPRKDRGSKSPINVKQEGSAEQTHKCNQCGKNFVKTQALKFHIKLCGKNTASDTHQANVNDIQAVTAVNLSIKPSQDDGVPDENQALNSKDAVAKKKKKKKKKKKEKGKDKSEDSSSSGKAEKEHTKKKKKSKKKEKMLDLESTKSGDKLPERAPFTGGSILSPPAQSNSDQQTAACDVTCQAGHPAAPGKLSDWSSDGQPEGDIFHGIQEKLVSLSVDDERVADQEKQAAQAKDSNNKKSAATIHPKKQAKKKKAADNSPTCKLNEIEVQKEDAVDVSLDPPRELSKISAECQDSSVEQNCKEKCVTMTVPMQQEDGLKQLRRLPCRIAKAREEERKSMERDIETEKMCRTEEASTSDIADQTEVMNVEKTCKTKEECISENGLPEKHSLRNLPCRIAKQREDERLMAQSPTQDPSSAALSLLKEPLEKETLQSPKNKCHNGTDTTEVFGEEANKVTAGQERISLRNLPCRVSKKVESERKSMERMLTEEDECVKSCNSEDICPTAADGESVDTVMEYEHEEASEADIPEEAEEDDSSSKKEKCSSENPVTSEETTVATHDVESKPDCTEDVVLNTDNIQDPVSCITRRSIEETASSSTEVDKPKQRHQRPCTRSSVLLSGESSSFATEASVTPEDPQTQTKSDLTMRNIKSSSPEYPDEKNVQSPPAAVDPSPSHRDANHEAVSNQIAEEEKKAKRATESPASGVAARRTPTSRTNSIESGCSSESNFSISDGVRGENLHHMKTGNTGELRRSARCRAKSLEMESNEQSNARPMKSSLKDKAADAKIAEETNVVETEVDLPEKEKISAEEETSSIVKAISEEVPHEDNEPEKRILPRRVTRATSLNQVDLGAVTYGQGSESNCKDNCDSAGARAVEKVDDLVPTADQLPHITFTMIEESVARSPKFGSVQCPIGELRVEVKKWQPQFASREVCDADQELASPQLTTPPETPICNSPAYRLSPSSVKQDGLSPNSNFLSEYQAFVQRPSDQTKPPERKSRSKSLDGDVRSFQSAFEAQLKPRFSSQDAREAGQRSCHSPSTDNNEQREENIRHLASFRYSWERSSRNVGDKRLTKKQEKVQDGPLSGSGLLQEISEVNIHTRFCLSSIQKDSESATQPDWMAAFNKCKPYVLLKPLPVMNTEVNKDASSKQTIVHDSKNLENDSLKASRDQKETCGTTDLNSDKSDVAAACLSNVNHVTRKGISMEPEQDEQVKSNRDLGNKDMEVANDSPTSIAKGEPHGHEGFSTASKSLNLHAEAAQADDVKMGIPPPAVNESLGEGTTKVAVTENLTSSGASVTSKQLPSLVEPSPPTKPQMESPTQGDEMSENRTAVKSSPGSPGTEPVTHLERVKDTATQQSEVFHVALDCDRPTIHEDHVSAKDEMEDTGTVCGNAEKASAEVTESVSCSQKRNKNSDIAVQNHKESQNDLDNVLDKPTIVAPVTEDKDSGSTQDSLAKAPDRERSCDLKNEDNTSVNKKKMAREKKSVKSKGKPADKVQDSAEPICSKELGSQEKPISQVTEEPSPSVNKKKMGKSRTKRKGKPADKIQDSMEPLCNEELGSQENAISSVTVESSPSVNKKKTKRDISRVKRKDMRADKVQNSIESICNEKFRSQEKAISPVTVEQNPLEKPAAQIANRDEDPVMAEETMVEMQASIETDVQQQKTSNESADADRNQSESASSTKRKIDSDSKDFPNKKTTSEGTAILQTGNKDAETPRPDDCAPDCPKSPDYAAVASRAVKSWKGKKAPEPAKLDTVADSKKKRALDKIRRPHFKQPKPEQDVNNDNSSTDSTLRDTGEAVMKIQDGCPVVVSAGLVQPAAILSIVRPLNLPKHPAAIQGKVKYTSTSPKRLPRKILVTKSSGNKSPSKSSSGASLFVNMTESRHYVAVEPPQAVRALTLSSSSAPSVLMASTLPESSLACVSQIPVIDNMAGSSIVPMTSVAPVSGVISSTDQPTTNEVDISQVPLVGPGTIASGNCTDMFSNLPAPTQSLTLAGSNLLQNIGAQSQPTVDPGFDTSQSLVSEAGSLCVATSFPSSDFTVTSFPSSLDAEPVCIGGDVQRGSSNSTASSFPVKIDTMPDASVISGQEPLLVQEAVASPAMDSTTMASSALAGDNLPQSPGNIPQQCSDTQMVLPCYVSSAESSGTTPVFISTPVTQPYFISSGDPAAACTGLFVTTSDVDNPNQASSSEGTQLSAQGAFTARKSDKGTMTENDDSDDRTADLVSDEGEPEYTDLACSNDSKDSSAESAIYELETEIRSTHSEMAASLEIHQSSQEQQTEGDILYKDDHVPDDPVATEAHTMLSDHASPNDPTGLASQTRELPLTGESYADENGVQTEGVADRLLPVTEQTLLETESGSGECQVVMDEECTEQIMNAMDVETSQASEANVDAVTEAEPTSLPAAEALTVACPDAVPEEETQLDQISPGKRIMLTVSVQDDEPDRYLYEKDSAGRYLCPCCDTECVFSAECSLHHHLQWVHDIKMEPVSSVQEESRICYICKTKPVFRDVTDLRCHMKWMHRIAHCGVVASAGEDTTCHDDKPAGKDEIPAGKDEIPAGKDEIPAGKDEIPAGDGETTDENASQTEIIQEQTLDHSESALDRSATAVPYASVPSSKVIKDYTHIKAKKTNLQSPNLQSSETCQLTASVLPGSLDAKDSQTLIDLPAKVNPASVTMDSPRKARSEDRSPSRPLSRRDTSSERSSEKDLLESETTDGGTGSDSSVDAGKTCSICHIAFLKLHHFQHHMRRFHPKPSVICSPVTRELTKPETDEKHLLWRCAICGSILSQYEGWCKHMKDHGVSVTSSSDIAAATNMERVTMMKARPLSTGARKEKIKIQALDAVPGMPVKTVTTHSDTGKNVVIHVRAATETVTSSLKLSQLNTENNKLPPATALEQPTVNKQEVSLGAKICSDELSEQVEEDPQRSCPSPRPWQDILAQHRGMLRTYSRKPKVEKLQSKCSTGVGDNNNPEQMESASDRQNNTTDAEQPATDVPSTDLTLPSPDVPRTSTEACHSTKDNCSQKVAKPGTRTSRRLDSGIGSCDSIGSNFSTSQEASAGETPTNNERTTRKRSTNQPAISHKTKKSKTDSSLKRKSLPAASAESTPRIATRRASLEGVAGMALHTRRAKAAEANKQRWKEFVSVGGSSKRKR